MENKKPDWMDRYNKLKKDIPNRVMSEEESQREEQERLEKMVTPELLSKFSRDETEKLVKYFDSCPSEPTFGRYHTYDLERLSQNAKEFLKKELQGKKIIELGSNASEDSRLWFECEFKAKEYNSADPSYNIDGLSYLMRQPDESAIVTSFGLLEDGVLYNYVSELKKYTELLGKEIYRVTPKGAITFHGLEYESDLINAGFKEPKNIPKEFNKKPSRNNYLKVLRK